MITVKINSMHLKSNEKTVLFREFVRKAFMQKRNECSQLFPLPLAIRKEICILIRVSLPISPRPPPSGLFARFHQEKYSAYLAFKGVYNFSNPALELFDPRMVKRKTKPFRKTNCFEDSQPCKQKWQI